MHSSKDHQKDNARKGYKLILMANEEDEADPVSKFSVTDILSARNRRL